jgi:hypothetical protein
MTLAGIPDLEVKALARRHGKEVIARGVLGSPWIFADGAPFWGSFRCSGVGFAGLGRSGVDCWRSRSVRFAIRQCSAPIDKGHNARVNKVGALLIAACYRNGRF